ncbi:chromosome partitioning protein ParA [Aureimonas ureilytica]|uniref:chromosome partitioning protein ParA n=1 Tax=Aureimonas ureilytica TaxID=401562 RepID=UPI003CF56F53
MIPVLSIGSLKTSGSSTLALALASVASAADIPVVLIDASRDKDIAAWGAKPGRPERCAVEIADDEMALERLVRAARRRGEVAIIDAGDNADLLRAGARLADKALIPVRFSPLSAYAALATDQLLRMEAGKGRRDRDWAFVASAVTTIPSRIARSIETMIERSPTPRLETGLVQRAAYEAPFMHGGTLFNLTEEHVSGLDRAQTEATMLAYEVGLLGGQIGARHSAPAIGGYARAA